ncbi:MAG TPA: PDR/VanB family oxidoreductase [Steroidobacteraceae bacterium]|nr:PDR/VanB family oxidoreductase [Steroidobacteraceae bacterium]
MTALEHTSEPLSLRLEAIRFAAKGTLCFEFVRTDGAELPPAQAGAHIGVHLPNGMVRQYSLLHAGTGLHSYQVGVKRDANSRGGSRYMHEELRVGTVLPVDPPRNNFPLAENAVNSLFFAGGIGITPMVAMLERLHEVGRPGSLYYACRTRDELAFLPDLTRTCQPQIHIDAEQGGRVFDLAAVISRSSKETHLYCCGPGPMLAAFETATADRPSECVHVEYFTPRDPPAVSGGFEVVLARSGRELHIPAGKSILQVLRDAGVPAPSSCEQGVCAACETRVIEGIPEHRDSILSAAERASNRTMMICVSGSRTGRLVLDL